MSSYHIRDLRLLLPAPDFDLRVNKHYAKASPLFQEWLQKSFHGDVARAEELFSHRFDLLCSVCFPAIDPPQLLRVSKLCALAFLAGDGHIQAETLPPQQDTGTSTSLPNLLDPDHLLEVAHSLRTRRARELEHSTLAATGINALLRLGGGLLSTFYSPQETNEQTAYPGLPELLAVLGAAYDRKFPEELVKATLLTALWRRTTNILIWSQDLASYTSRHPQKCHRCAVCCSIEGQGFTLQAAVNDIGQTIQSEVERFTHDYKSLTTSTCDNEDAITVANAMRDCIAGFVHWIYEGKRYFGTRHEEVSKFGWVFTGAGGNEVDAS